VTALSIPESHLAQEAIAALVDGELPSGPAGRAARHLAGCAQCRMAVQAQREAKEALHECADVTVPGDLLSRLCAIPFTTDVPTGRSLGSLHAGPGGLTMDGATGGWSVDLESAQPPARPDHARWLRRGITGTLAGLSLGVALLAFTLPGDESGRPGRVPVAGPTVPEERTEVVPPVTRTLTVGDATTLSARGSDGSP
jgi:anti-sigma factor RsiW